MRTCSSDDSSGGQRADPSAAVQCDLVIFAHDELARTATQVLECRQIRIQELGEAVALTQPLRRITYVQC